MRLVGLLLALALGASPYAGAEIIQGSFYSPALGVKKSYRVYVPDGYAQSKSAVPVIYLLHGWGVDESYWSEHLDLAAAAKEVNLNALVVMPDGDRSYYANSSTPPDYKACLAGDDQTGNAKEPRGTICVRRAAYEDYIVKDLVPHIDARFRTIPTRAARAISGESAGGYGAMAIAMRNTALFGSVAAHSAFLSLLYDGPRPYRSGKVSSRDFIDPEAAPAAAVRAFGLDVAYWRAHDPVLLAPSLRDGELRIYFDCGTEDEYKFHADAEHLSDALSQHGIQHQFHLLPGRHDDTFWKAQIVKSLRFHQHYFLRSR